MLENSLAVEESGVVSQDFCNSFSGKMGRCLAVVLGRMLAVFIGGAVFVGVFCVKPVWAVPVEQDFLDVAGITPVGVQTVSGRMVSGVSGMRVRKEATFVDTVPARVSSVSSLRASSSSASNNATNTNTGSGSGIGVDGSAGAGGDFKATSLSGSGLWVSGGSDGGFTYSVGLGVVDSASGMDPGLSLVYSSQMVDGKTSVTNNQSSVVGEGWDLSGLGFIERSFVSCAKDNLESGANSKVKSGDLCWKSDNATVSFAGRSGELVHVGGSVWRLRNDDGTRFERLGVVGGVDEKWVATTSDGVRYWFGKGTAGGATNSVWQVPVAGNHAGEPGYNTDFAVSFASRTWRWNLDFIEDLNGNTISVYYVKEQNKYGQNMGAKTVEYTRGGYPVRVEYGQRKNSLNTRSAQIVFDYAERCLNNCGVLNASTAKNWPDVPQDMICDQDKCTNSQIAPTFFTRKRLTSIRSQVLDGGQFVDVKRWDLKHSFPDPGDGMLASLWLDSVQIASGDGKQIERTIRFTGTAMPNRVDEPVGSGWSVGGPMNKYRITDIDTGVGSTIVIGYSVQDCSLKNRPDPAKNNSRCFPVYWNPDYIQNSDRLDLHWFNKYVVERVEERDNTATSAARTITNYQYTNPGWRWNDSLDVEEKYRTFNVWAGYQKVSTIVGELAKADSLRTDRLYYQGLSNDGKRGDVFLTDSTGAKTKDEYVLAGGVREEIMFNGVNGPEIEGSITTYKSVKTSPGTSKRESYRVDLTQTQSRETLSDGRGVRKTQTNTTYDEHGFPIQVENQGDLAVTGDETCSKTGYARNKDAWILDRIATSQVRAGKCSTFDTNVTKDKIITDSKTFYDNSPLGVVKDRGLSTSTETAKDVVSGKIEYQKGGTTTYDVLGRETSYTNALGATTNNIYTPADGGLLTKLVTKNALGQETITEYDPKTGLPVLEKNVSGITSQYEYDMFARLTKVWADSRNKNQKPSATFEYITRDNTRGGNAVITNVLNGSGGDYYKNVTIYDGLLRQVQTQTAAQDSKVKDKNISNYFGSMTRTVFYDHRGLVTETHGEYFSQNPPANAYVDPLGTKTLPKWSKTIYDGAGRETKTTFYGEHDKELHSTTTIYNGDSVKVIPPTGSSMTETITNVLGQITEKRIYKTRDVKDGYWSAKYTYDLADRLTRLEDHAGNKWVYEYDVRGNKVAETTPDAGRAQTNYDALDRVIETIDATGNKIGYVYDVLGRQTKTIDNTNNQTLTEHIYDTITPGLLSETKRHLTGNDNQTYVFSQQITRYDQAGRVKTRK